MKYRGFLAALLLVAFTSAACEDTKDDIIAAAAGDPVPVGMGVMTATAAAGAINAVALVLNESALAASKPSLRAASSTVPIGVFPEDDSIDCDTGSMTITGTAPGDLTVTFSNCQDGPYVVNGGAAINIPDVRSCAEDGDSHDVPVSMTATVNNGTTVSVDGQVLALTNFGVAVTSPLYNGAPDRAEEGGTCGIVGGNVVATGVVSTEFEGETTTINFGSSSLNVTFEANETSVLAELDGTITVDTLCTDGPFELTLSPFPGGGAPLEFPDGGDGTPTGGILVVNGENVDFSDPNVNAIPCSGFL
jgi:hypothetical protein